MQMMGEIYGGVNEVEDIMLYACDEDHCKKNNMYAVGYERSKNNTFVCVCKRK